MMTTTLETAHTVAAVLSVFHNAANLMKQVCKRTKKKKKSEEAMMMQRLLLETLESGELQISQKYAQYLEAYGARYKTGDDTSRDRIQHVAIIMQAEFLRSIQLASEYENAKLDARKLHEDVLFFRRDVLSALDELKDRLEAQSPGQGASVFSQMVPTSPTSSTPGSSPFSQAGATPDEDEEGGRRISRLFSMRSRPHKRASTSSTISSLLVAPTLSSLGPMQEEPKRYELAAEDVPRSRSRSPFQPDVKVALPEPDTEMLHPALAKQTSINRHLSTSTHSSEYSEGSRYSTFSDEKIPILYEDPQSPFPDASEIAAALPPASSLHPAPLNIRPRQGRASSTSATSQPGSGIPSPTDTTPSHTGVTPDYSPHSYWFPNNPTSPPAPSPLTLPIITRERSNTALSGSSTPSSRNESIFRPASITSNPSSTNTAQLVGRPEKKNNYWGFCKGSWTIREDWRKGLVIQVLPSGMYSQHQVWQCKSCQFRGKLYGAKKPFVTDPNVHEDPDTGVRYRWIFLAKSHAKVGHSQKEGDAGYGCLLCSLGNVHTGIYGSQATLFRHILDDHASSMTDAMAQRAKCVVGRIAEPKEDFDINIL